MEAYVAALGGLVLFLEAKGVRRPAEVTPAVMEEYRLSLVRRKLAPATVALYLRAAKLLFRHLEATRRILASPAEGLAPVRQQRKLMPVPSLDEVRRLLAVPDTATAVGLRDRALLETAYGTAARLQEMLQLEVKDLSLEAGTARLLGKGNRERVVPLGREAVNWLRKYLAEARPALLRGGALRCLWVDAWGAALNYGAFRCMFRARVRAAGLGGRLSPHALRRACATHMLANGAHPVQIQALLGHATLRHLRQYLQVTARDIKGMHAQSRVGE